MGKQITILGNDTKKSPEIQFAQIYSEFQNVSKFLNGSISNNVSVDLNLSSDISITSTSFVKIPQMQLSFSNNSELICIYVHLCCSGADTYFDIQIDNQSILNRPFLVGSAKHTFSVAIPKQIGVGNHILSVLWKTTGTSTIHKDGYAGIQITNIF